MLWAATVFFPPAAAVAGAAAGASRATKIASLLGATVGSGTYTQLKAHPPTKPLAKKRRVPPLPALAATARLYADDIGRRGQAKPTSQDGASELYLGPFALP